MFVPRLPTLPTLVAAVRTWAVESQQVARRNAMVAATACTRRRIERQDVDDFLQARFAPPRERDDETHRCTGPRGARLTQDRARLGHNQRMPTSAARSATASSISHHDIRSDDGTHLRAWTNDPDLLIDGPTVVLCNGLGTNPYMWPALLRPDCGVRVVSWYHRGVGGSDRPRDPSHVEIEHFVEDGLSVMDHFGIDSAVLMGWSMGVNTMFELAVRHPERVSGLFAVCGVPGDTFRTMLAPLHVPHAVARALTDLRRPLPEPRGVGPDPDRHPAADRFRGRST